MVDAENRLAEARKQIQIVSNNLEDETLIEDLKEVDLSIATIQEALEGEV